MTTRWPSLHCCWVLWALAPMLAQAAGPAPGLGGITTPGPRGPDAAPLAALLPELVTESRHHSALLYRMP
jgi:hypothetical protein